MPRLSVRNPGLFCQITVVIVESVHLVLCFVDNFTPRNKDDRGVGASINLDVFPMKDVGGY